MKKGILLLLLVIFSLLFSSEIQADRIEPLSARTDRCFGMYSKASVPGSKTPASITLAVSDIEGEFAYVIFNEKDSKMIGYHEPNGSIKYICTLSLKEENKCFNNQVGEFIVNSTMTNSSFILNGGTYLLNGDNDINSAYPVTTKGFYCLMFHNLTAAYAMNGSLYIKNPYGDLPAEIYPYLPFYGFVGLAYLVVCIIWTVLSACYWKDILQVQENIITLLPLPLPLREDTHPSFHFVSQNCISGIIFLCMLEMTFQYAFYADYNDRGVSSNGLLAIAVILNSARNSASFVALLVICMGYGLVKPTLGSTAQKIIGLGFCHFIFGTLFAASSMRQTAASQKLLALMFVFPLAITLTLFYSWTFNSLTITIKKLEIRRQTKKTLVYRRLWRLLMFSIVVLFIFLVLTIIQRYDDNYQRENWDTLWFTADGWIHLLYFFMFISIIFLWRPQKNNQRLGMTEVPADDDEDAMVSAGGVSKVKMRALKKKGKQGSEDEEEDALKWVEENLSEPEDLDPLSLVEENEEKVSRRELAKMN